MGDSTNGPPVIELPNKQINQLDSALQTVSNAGDTKGIEELLMRGANINAKGGMYGSALQAAIAGGQLEAVRLLVDKDAKLEAIARFCMP
jgi:ankyrin repeat protein